MIKKILKPFGIFIGTIIIIVSFSICAYIHNPSAFLIFTLGDALALLTATVVGYYLVESRNDERELGKEVLKIIEIIQTELMERDYLHINPKQNRSIVLNNNRWLNNQIYLLERISVKITRLKRYTENIRKTYNEYEGFVSANLDQDEEYFDEPDRYDKQKNRIGIIEFNLQQMMLAIYKVPDIKMKK